MYIGRVGKPPGLCYLGARRDVASAPGTGSPERGLMISAAASCPSGRPRGMEFVGESVDKGLAAEALPVGQLDKPEAAIIDHAACPQRLDSGALQNHLRALGFSAALGGLRRGPAAAKEPFRRPALARAEEGLLHVMGVLRERDEVRTGFERSARRLQHPLYRFRLGSAAFDHRDIERRDASSRPKIGMVPSVRTVGLASA